MNLFLQFPAIFDENQSIVKSLAAIQAKIKSNKTLELYYSKENLDEFIRYNQETETYLTSDIKLLRHYISSSNSYQISINTNEITYFQWNIDKYECQQCNSTLQKIAEEVYNNNQYKCVLINFNNTINACRNKILLFRDAKHLDFPDYFLKIDYVINEIELFEWLKTNHIQDFSLRNEQQFQKRPEIIVKGATVYYEEAEDRYWHLDTFHNYVEYEVYDGNGIHIGTADENGVLNTSKRKSGRKLHNL